MSGSYTKGNFQSSFENDGSGSRTSTGGRSEGSTIDSSQGAVWNIDINEVEVGDLVASGSFGMVHSGKYKGNKVAVKFLMFPEGTSEQELGRAKHAFRKEIAVWYRLRHPNIVEFLGAFIEPPKWAIVTEFLDGGSLKTYLSRQNKKRLPLRSIVSMALDIAKGMEYLHWNNIIHRDIKSANMLLDPNGVVKVADFGLARTESEPGNMTAETGTIRWMAPEMIDHKPYTRKVDVYSFGIVLWELSTCQWPFEGFSFVQLAYAIVHDGLRPNTRDIPPLLADLMTRCWDPNPELRPDFSEIVKTLEEALDAAGGSGGKSLESVMNKQPDFARKPVPKNPLPHSDSMNNEGWKPIADVSSNSSAAPPSCGCIIS